MSSHEWPAQDYAIGSFIQSTVAENYLKDLKLKSTDNVLDIGCGNGSFSQKILKKIPQGSLFGIDASENMLKLARKDLEQYTNVTLQQNNAITMKFDKQFDYIVSFWCLQWCAAAIETVFQNIYQALKPGGKILTILPAGDDPYITSYDALKASSQFECLKDFETPLNYQHLDNLEEKLNRIPFKKLKVERIQQELLLPELDIFRKFVNGIAFYQGQIPTEQIKIINEAMVEVYALECQEKYDNQYRFHFSLYLITAEK